jgi:hypothetical protein
MATSTNTTTKKIALAAGASKAGLLVDYPPAKPASNADSKEPLSWGPAMRV